MMIIFNRSTLLSNTVCICSFIGLLLVLSVGLISQVSVPVFSETETPVVWVIDAGHGGEDGGAVSADGVKESTLNLEISLRVHDLFRFVGENTMLTRTTEAAVYTEGDTIRARKASDIRNRVELVNQADHSVLLSIHQNSLPASPVTHGAQVFWNPQDHSKALAESVQTMLNQVINVGNEKLPRKISDTIYLMNHITAPAILIECGFLSNAEETLCLQNDSYQKKLAAAISAGCLQILM